MFSLNVSTFFMSLINDDIISCNNVLQLKAPWRIIISEEQGTCIKDEFFYNKSAQEIHVVLQEFCVLADKYSLVRKGKIAKTLHVYQNCIWTCLPPLFAEDFDTKPVSN